MSRRPVVLLPHPLDEAAEARLAAHVDLRRVADPDNPVAVRAAIAECDALVARTHLVIDEELLAAAPRLRVVGVAGVGLDRVDESAAAARGVIIRNTPAAATAAVAELTLALLLQLLRPIPRLAGQYRDGHYRAARSAPHGDELESLRIGILGLGRIGGRVARACAAGLGAAVCYHDIVEIPDPPVGCRAVGFDELLETSDVLTIHTPLTERTRGLFDASLLARCRPGARLINTARGEIVVTGALTAALRSGHLAGAGLDVTAPEPLPTGHPLFELEQCILTPHIAARTHGGLRRMYGVVDLVLAELARLPEFVLDLDPAVPDEEQ